MRAAICFNSELFPIGGVSTVLFAYAVGAVAFRRLPLPLVLRFGLGAALLSLAQFVLLCLGWGAFPYWLGFALFAWGLYRRPAFLWERVTQPLDRFSIVLFGLIFAGYGIFYLVNALAPEIQPDAVAYHLGLAAEYLRRGAFSPRIGFYEMLPQGLEMLFTIALAHGDYTSAKLVHFAFLLASARLIVLIARRLELPEAAGYGAAALYFAAPVVGICGSSAYNDAALVFFTLCAFYLLPLGSRGYTLAAGIAAGFCFAIKPTGLLVPALGMLYLIRRPREMPLLCAGAALMAAPWMLRDAVLTGNPLAPLFNSWFPNPYFSASTDRTLAQILTSYDGVRWFQAPWQWAYGGRLAGATGPLLFLIPVGLLAWKKRGGALVLAAGALLLVPVWFNLGTRFLMPALPFFALAIAMALPRPAALACVVAQAVLCMPVFVEAWQDAGSWSMLEFPWRAALRLEPESRYLGRALGDMYGTANLLQTDTAPAERTFALTTVARAYTTRETLEFWHSNRASQLAAALISARGKASTDSLRAQWPVRAFHAIRVVATSDLTRELAIREVRLFAGTDRIFANSRWFVQASPNPWDGPGAFDGNLATAWSTQSPQKRGMYVEAEFERAYSMDGVELLVEHTNAVPELLIQGQEQDGGRWERVADAFVSAPAPDDALRHEAIRALKGAGFAYLLGEAGSEGMGQIGQDMLRKPGQWGVEVKGRFGDVYLFRLL